MGKNKVEEIELLLSYPGCKEAFVASSVLDFVISSTDGDKKIIKAISTNKHYS
jgi:hypothetical protein